MPSFNPSVPEQQAPNYIYWSKPIEQPQADKGLGIGLEGASKALDLGVSGAMDYLKGQESEKIHAALDPVRDAQIAALTDANSSHLNNQANAATNMQPNTSNDEGPAGDQIPPNAILNEGGVTPAPVPQAVQSGLDAVAQTANAVKLKPELQTYYTGQTYAIAKELRSQYPGMRDYIDSEISKVTGGDPANMHMNALTTAIQAASANAQAEREKTLTKMRENIGADGMPDLMQAYRTGQINQYQAETAMSKTLAFKYQQEVADARFKTAEANKNYTALDAGLDLSKKFNNMATGIMTQTMGQYTPLQMQELIGKQARGEIDIPTAQWQQMAQSVASAKMSLVQQMDSYASVRNAQGISRKDIMGPTEYQKQIDSSTLLLDNLQKAIGAKDVTAMGNHAEWIKGSQDDAKYNLFRYSPDNIRQYVTNYNLMKETMGPTVADQVSNGWLTNGLSGEINNYMRLFQPQAFVQPQMAQTGQPVTLKDGIQAAQKAGITAPQVYKEFLGMSQHLSDPNTADTGKINLAYTLFSDQNQGLLEKFQKDSTDPQTGRFIPGKMSILNQLASEKNARSVSQLTHEGNPQLMPQMEKWSRNEFGSALKSEFATLQDLPSGMHVNWDNEKNELSIVPNFKPSTDPNQPYYGTPNQAQYGRYGTALTQSVSNINIGLRALSNVAKYSGMNVQDYMMQTLQEMGYKPNAEATGFPEKMMTAIIAANRLKQPIKE